MAQARKILIADADLTAVRALTRSLRQRGYQVQHAADGSKALNLAVLRHPDVILFDEKCALIDARSFAQILESNPRTDDIPVVVTSNAQDSERHRLFREGVLCKPFNIDEVISRIEHLCRRLETSRELKGDAREIEGALTQLPLGDLVQILAMNRRTGKLTLTHGPERGELQLANGRPVNARLGAVEGEKALYRLFGWRNGSFAFSPGPAPARAMIDLSMEGALLEGMRQVDERVRLLEGLPPPSQVLSLEPSAAEPVEPHPVTAEVLRVLDRPRKLSEVLDLVASPDLEVLGAITALLQRGVVRRHEGTAAVEGPILAAAEVHALRGRLLRGKMSRTVLDAKVLVCGTGPLAGRWLQRALPGLHPASIDGSCLRSSFGTLGRLDISDVLKIDFVMLPASEAARPLWRPFASGAVGALVMEETDAVLNLARFCGFEFRLPLVLASGASSNGAIASQAVPPVLRGAPAGVTVVTTDLAAAVRALLLATLRIPSMEAPETVLARSRTPGQP